MKPYQRAYIEITNVCNLQCDFCPEVERPARRMSLPLFERAILEVQNLVDEVTFHVMGEPLAHPEFSKFVDVCAQQAMPIHLTTNGTLLEHAGADGKPRAEVLLNPIFRQINFSLQSFPSNTRRSAEDRAAQFESYLQHIFQFTQRALIERPDLYINFRLWNLGTDEADRDGNRKFLDPICREFDCDLRGGPAEGVGRANVGFRKSYRVKGRLYVHFDSRFEWPSLERAVLQTKGHCHALRSHFGILSDGTVVPCCLDKEAGIALGRINENCLPGELARLLANDRARRLREGFDRGELCEPLCQRCSFISRFS